MRKLRNGFLALILLPAIQTAWAQEARQVSLSEAIRLGMENSNQVKLALSKSREAHAAKREMKDHIIPDVDISGQYMRLNEPNVSINPMLLGNKSGSESGGSQAAPGYLMLGQASVSMPLFSGFRIKNGIRSAEYLEKAATLDVESQRSEVILNIVGAYINLYKAQTAVKMVEENLRQSQQRVGDFSNLEKNGLLAQNDLLKAQLQESNTSLALLDAKNNQKVANYNMNLMLGLSEDTELKVDSISDMDLPQLVSVGELREKAVQQRQDLQAMNEREKAGEAAVKVSKSEYWPSIGLSAGYVAADVQDVLTVTNALNVGLGLKFNLSSLYKAGAKVDQARERYLQTQLMHDQLSDKVKSEVFKSFSDYEESVQRITVYEKARQQSAENYRITKNKHTNNLATTTELLDADIERFRAELNLKYAKADAILAYCKLLQVSGSLADQESIDQLLRQ